MSKKISWFSQEILTPEIESSKERTYQIFSEGDFATESFSVLFFNLKLGAQKPNNPLCGV